MSSPIISTYFVKCQLREKLPFPTHNVNIYIYIKTIDPLNNYNFDYCFKATAGPNFPIPTSPGSMCQPAWQLAAAAQLPGPRPSYQCQGHQRHRGPPRLAPFSAGSPDGFNMAIW